eukprot:jgi/Botrbrau1/12192/Bobra.0186s0098.1
MSLNMKSAPEVQSFAQEQFDVSKAYEGARILLTGATGYIGGLCLVDLLRLCPGVEKVYVAIRPKRNQDPSERLKKLFQDPMFSNLEKDNSGVFDKVEVLPVSLEERDCGIDQRRLRLLNESITHVIHCASAIRFDLEISDVMRQNFTSTLELLELSKRFQNLKAWCYVSTAFVNLNLPQNARIEEKIYPLSEKSMRSAGAKNALELAELWRSKLSPENAQKNAMRFIKKEKFVNTYTISKNLTEQLVMMYREHFPVLISRPTLVSCISRDPLPGYIGNSSGITGAVIGGAHGILTHVSHAENSKVPVVPGDLVSHGTLVATAAVAEGRTSKEIFHICTSDSDTPVRNWEFYTTLLQFAKMGLQNQPNLQSKDPNKWKIRFMHNSLQCTLHNIQQGAKIQAAAAYLKWKGDKKLAQKLKLGWTGWKDLNKRSKDMNYTFVCDGMRELQNLIPQKDAFTWKCIWSSRMGDDWKRYLYTYGAGVGHLYLKQTPDPRQYNLHDYRPVGNRIQK